MIFRDEKFFFKTHCPKKNRAIIWPSNSTTGYTSKGYEISVSEKDTSESTCCNTIHNSQEMG